MSLPTIYNIVLPPSCINISAKRRDKVKLLNGEYCIQNINNSQLRSVRIPVSQDWHKAKYGFNLSESEIEIFLMHRLAWQYFLQSDNHYCIILGDWPLVLEEQIPCLSKLNLFLGDWDILFPFSEKDVLEEKDELENIKLKNYNLRERGEYESYLLGRKWGSFIYFITRKGAEKLLMVKEIMQNIDDEILLLSYERRLNVYCQSFKFFKYAHRPKSLIIDREKEIYTTIMANNVWKKESITMAKDLLNIVTTMAAQLSIDLILEGGTLLGYVQHGGLLPWDDDIDFGIYYKDIRSLLLKIKGIRKIKVDTIIEERSGKAFYKIWSVNGAIIEDKPYTFPFIDLWPYDIVNRDIQFTNGVIYTNAASKGFIDVMFEGYKLKIPFNAVQCLNTRYKTWKKMIRVYRWSHQQEKDVFYPLTVKIKTNRNGRMVAPLYQLLGNDNSEGYVNNNGVQQIEKQTMRWNVINYLIQKNHYKSYTEIGYYRGWSFDNIKCEQKIAVDPNPSKTHIQKHSEYGSLHKIGEGDEILYKLTSDDYFEKTNKSKKEGLNTFESDIFFIDGLHTASQAERDIKNALDHLKEGGTIVIHDCSPSSHEMVTTGTKDCEWTGDVYKAFINFRIDNPDMLTFTIDTDYGIGVIIPSHKNTRRIEKPVLKEKNITWNEFSPNRKYLLNLITVKEFFNMGKDLSCSNK